MSLGALDAAVSGLRIAQQQMNTISNNVANVGTPGYTRKILPQSSKAVEGNTVGVSSDPVVRNVDLNLTRDLWTQISGASSFDVKKAYLDRVVQFHGPPDRELSVAAAISRLHDAFAALSDAPADAFQLAATLDKAVDTASKINDFSRLITTLRNDAQTEMDTAVRRANSLLERIADGNNQIEAGTRTGRSVAALQDNRDEAVKELAGLMDISFFVRGDGVMVIQTAAQSVELVSDTAKVLIFDYRPVSAQSYYPESVQGIYVGESDPDPNAVDITEPALGGKLGGLIELRDTTFPKQMAQLDELAHKMALRMQAQGLTLFTDGAGVVPLDTAPDPTTLPDPTPVTYVGFSNVMRVNQAIINDPTLLQKGTYGAAMPSGSNEVIRRVLQFGFGEVDHQEAIGDLDLRVAALAAPNNTLQNFLGLYSTNTITGTRNLASFLSAADLVTASNNQLGNGSDVVRLTFDDPDLPPAAFSIDIDLSAVADGGGNFVQDLIAHITGTLIPALTAPQQAAIISMNVQFSEGSNGQLVISSRGDVTLDPTVASGMGESGLAILGFSADTYEATDPYFDISVGNNPPTRITIGPADDEIDLMAQLDAVPGLAYDDISTNGDGFLRLRPGNDYDSPDFGGDMTIISGPFTAAGAGANTVIGAGTVPDGTNVVSALFSSFSTGPLQNRSPVVDVDYASQTDASLAPPIPTLAFRTSLLGTGTNTETLIVGATSIADYAQKLVNENTQEQIRAEGRFKDSKSLKDALQRQMTDGSGVNLDEELAHLIIVQTAYNAAARMLGAINSIFQELMNAVR